MYICNICMYVRMYVCMYVCTYVCMYVCMYVRMYACMHVCMYIYVCMYVCMYRRVPFFEDHNFRRFCEFSVLHKNCFIEIVHICKN